jgi:hypothetical protein
MAINLKEKPGCEVKSFDNADSIFCFVAVEET